MFERLLVAMCWLGVFRCLRALEHDQVLQTRWKRGVSLLAGLGAQCSGGRPVRWLLDGPRPF